ncbi:MAG TPA: hypothetical protein GX404_05190 [Syntrophomonadaceae bacterium]|nr:hypothetical protein [Syntrophomonadaceae bacterium]
MNLDAAQNRETDNNLHRSNDTVDIRIKETYCWLLVPYIDRSVDMKNFVWDVIRISGGSDSIVSKASKKMIQNEALITKWAPALLLMELDNLLWREEDSISIKKLWEYLCTYCYLQRLADYSVLEETIRSGLNSTEYFAIAAGRSEERFIDLKYNQYIGIIENSAYLVKNAVALKQVAETQANQPKQPPYPKGETPTQDGGEVPVTFPGSISTPGNAPTSPPQPEQIKNTHFYMSAQLDTTRINRDVQRLVEEVISHLISVDGCEMHISVK